MITLFHGSYISVPSPLVGLGRKCVDFGQGFYPTKLRKQSRIIVRLAEMLQIDDERALDLFYSTNIYRQLSDPKYGLQLMSDDYILEDLIKELRDTQ